jgi:hypothetical protein
MKFPLARFVFFLSPLLFDLVTDGLSKILARAGVLQGVGNDLLETY